MIENYFIDMYSKMKKNTKNSISLILVAACVIALIGVVIWMVTKKSKGPCKACEGFALAPKDVINISNHLKQEVKLVNLKDGNEDYLLNIPGNSNASFDSSAFEKGNTIRIYVVDSTGKETIYNDIFMITDPPAVPGVGAYEGKMVFPTERPPPRDFKEFHIGQVTTRLIGTDRWQGGEYDTSNGGMPWIRIHNNTDKMLHLNNNIQVAPHDTFRYRGRHTNGIPLGSFFKNPDGLYDTIQILAPISDVYYGITSDIKQELFGGWQATFNEHEGGTIYSSQFGVGII